MVLALLAAVIAPAAASGQPNIVLVLTDDQRWDTVGVMPNVRRELAARGVTFSNAFAVNPLCCPSRASFLTGDYSHTTGVYNNVGPHGGVTWFDDSSTLATWLADAGYRTGFVGKYLNGYRQDFVPPGWHRWVGYAGGFFGYRLNVDGVVVPFGYGPYDYSTDVFTREAISFVEASPGPFFLLYAPYAPHGPATPAPRHLDAFADLAPWRPRSHNERNVADKPRWLRARAPLTQDEVASLDDFRRRQLASILAVDDGVGALVAELRRSGRLANTVIVFASDNGLLWGEHRQANRKVSAFEESIRIPLVVRYDALVRRGREDARLVTNIDLAPTLAELAGVPAPRTDGRSLVPLLASADARATTPWRDRFLVEHLRGRFATAEVPTYCAVRDRRFKYVVYSTREEELYDLAADPHEQVNRARSPALRRSLLALRLDVKELCDPPPPGFDLEWLCTLESDSGSVVLGGTDRADTICGGPASEELRGFGGTDTVRGAAGADVVDGGDAADRLYPGRGRDVVVGDSGDDVVFARDARRDRIRCGPGRDVVYADRGDVVAGCESVRRPRSPGRRSPNRS